MPPDRTPGAPTTPSFLHAIQSGAPLSSHGVRHAPSLPRGSSCTTCRARKVRCDAGRPCCGACKKSAIAHGEDWSHIECNYAEAVRRPKKTNKVAELEAKLARLEEKLERGPRSASTSHSPAETPAAGPSSTLRRDETSPMVDEQAPTNTAADIAIPSNGYTQTAGNNHSSGSDSFGQDMASSSSTFDHLTAQIENNNRVGGHSNDGMVSISDFNNEASGSYGGVDRDQLGVAPSITSAEDPLAEYGFRQNIPTQPPTFPGLPASFPRSRITVLTPLGWPPALPSPPLLHRLIDVFFSKFHLATDLIVEGKFRAALALPPSHPKFPLPSLLHGMLAISGRMVSSDWFADEPKQWGLSDPDESFADWHAAKADSLIDEAFSKASNQRIRVAQAAGLVCFSFYTAGKFAKVWLQVARLTRIIVGLGLNHVRAATRGKDGVLRDRSLHMKQSVLPPTDDPEDLYERAAACQMAFLADKIATASTAWACSLDEADITTLIPPPHGVSYPAKDLDTSPLSSWNANFFVDHPPGLVAIFQIYLKCTYLLGRVTTFLSRAPYPIGMSLARMKTDGSKLTVADIRNSETFRRLEVTIRQFQQSVPREIQNIYTLPNADTRLALIFAIPHVCLIMLHEPFVTLVENDDSFGKCIASARAILGSVYTLCGSSFEIGGLAPFLSYCYAATGRTLVREIAIRKLRGQDSTHIFEEMQTILIVLDEFNTPLGATTAETLRSLLAMPELCLPHRPRYAKEDELDNIDEPLGHPVFASPYKLPARLGKVPLNAWVGPGYSDAAKPSPLWQQSIPSWSVDAPFSPDNFADLLSPETGPLPSTSNVTMNGTDSIAQLSNSSPSAVGTSRGNGSAPVASAPAVDYLEALLQSEASRANEVPSRRFGRGWAEKKKGGGLFDEATKGLIGGSNGNRFNDVPPSVQNHPSTSLPLGRSAPLR
ncbi:BQ2448_3452 [Microbotryum intermedium]|uniref:BQ2448_3452 protein n=1 Tax=Microbotryum intermedium TaxID=269621 RepID=A0A238FA22_9BASI|nr:BQ2448_3452 [Microbotryum intermedium]